MLKNSIIVSITLDLFRHLKHRQDTFPSPSLLFPEVRGLCWEIIYKYASSKFRNIQQITLLNCL